MFLSGNRMTRATRRPLFQEEITRLHANGRTAAAIGRELGIGKRLVLLRFKRFGLVSMTRSQARKTWAGPNKGKVLSPEWCAKMRLAKLGTHQSAATIAKRSASMKIHAVRGPAHYMWKGGVTPENKKLRRSREFKLWREAVFSRDDWTCQTCGDRGGRGHKVTLHPDHIKPWCDYPALRFDVANGRTLCVGCHKKTPTWGVNSTFQ